MSLNVSVSTRAKLKVVIWTWTVSTPLIPSFFNYYKSTSHRFKKKAITNYRLPMKEVTTVGWSGIQKIRFGSTLLAP